MSAEASLQRLTATTDVFLDPGAFPRDLVAAAADLYEHFSAIIGISEDTWHGENAAETYLSEGKAISPQGAARCVTDFLRTRQFLRGVHAGIVEAKKRFPGRCIEVLYAGCGPFATLAIPLMTRFTPREVQFTLLDIHQRSLDAAMQITRTLGLEGYVRDPVLCDACTYEHPADSPMHLVVLEVMQKALAKEPQVAVTANLVRQLDEGGILIPERIAIDACLADRQKEFRLYPAEGPPPPEESPDRSFRERIQLGRILEVTADSIGQILARAIPDRDRSRSLPPVVVSIPQVDNLEALSAMLLTSIQTFGPFGLGDYDSGLTCPEYLRDLSPSAAGGSIEFQYVLGETPGFRHRILDPEMCVAL